VGKIIVWIIVVFAILFVLRLLSMGKARRDREARNASKGATPGPMVRCADCGVFLPQAEALPAPQGFACGDPKCANRIARSR
jgi:uncharacterized protein